MQSKYGRISLVLASLTLPVTLLVGAAVGWYFKTTNPDSVDITAGLAYLRQILGSSLVTFALMAGASLTAGLIGLRNDKDKALSKLGLVLLSVIVVVSTASGMFNKSAGDTEEQYKAEKARVFFKQLMQ